MACHGQRDEVGERTTAGEIALGSLRKGDGLAQPFQHLSIDPGSGVVVDDIGRMKGGVEQASQYTITRPGATRPAPEAWCELSEGKGLHEFQEILVCRPKPLPFPRQRCCKRRLVLI